MKGMTAFACMSDIREHLIEESLELFEQKTAAPVPKPQSAFSRFINSGWGVAAVCALVSVFVMGGIIWAGFNPPSGRPDDTATETQEENLIEPESENDNKTETESETETEETNTATEEDDVYMDDGWFKYTSITFHPQEYIFFVGEQTNEIATAVFSENPLYYKAKLSDFALKIVSDDPSVVEIVSLDKEELLKVSTSLSHPNYGLTVKCLKEGTTRIVMTVTYTPTGGTHTIYADVTVVAPDYTDDSVPESENTPPEPSETTTEPEPEETPKPEITDVPEPDVTAEPETESPYSVGLDFVSNGDGSCYVAGIGTCMDRHLVIPPTSPNGERVTAIGDSAFLSVEQVQLNSVTLPDSVIFIGNEAFHNNYWLTSVSLGNGIQEIGSGAFSACSNLNRITIPDGVTYIGEQAFFDCDSLTSMAIPDSVAYIGDGAFSDCELLTGIEVDTANPVYHSRGQCLIHSESKTLITGCSASVIPDDGSVTRIANSAFRGCRNLTSVTIPDCVTYIGNDAFAYCDSLTDIVIPNGVSELGDKSFAYCRSLKNATLGCGVTIMGNEVFSECKVLENLAIKDGATVIGEKAFFYCKALKTVVIPDSVTQIGGSAFSDCYSLERVVLPGGLTSISSSLFDNCTSLIDVAIPDSVLEIHSEAFSDCSALADIRIPDGALYMGTGAFEGCTALTHVAIPDSVTNLGTSVFGSCTSLISASVGEGVTRIEASMFTHCVSLRNLTISDNVTSIDDSAFRFCIALKTITIGHGVTSIKARAFYDCSALAEVYYVGTAEEWEKISIGLNNSPLTSATVYYYTATKPTESGNYWHYVDGVAVPW